MSRNLGRTDCRRCGAIPQLTGPERAMTEREGGPQYEGMIVADATCPLCGARYLAWVSVGPVSGPHRPRYDDEPPFRDLSYRSSFNDEPGEGDLPPWHDITAQRALELLCAFMVQHEAEFEGFSLPAQDVIRHCECAACKLWMAVKGVSPLPDDARTTEES